MDITFDLTGVDMLRSRLEALASALPQEIGAALYMEAQIEATESRRRTPVLSGALRDSHHVTQPEIVGDDISVMIQVGGVSAPYAIYVHEGTAPHVITVKVKKVLANTKMGKIFGRVVHHPGSPPNKFIPRIIAKSQGEINAGFMSALNFIAQDLARNSSA